MNTKLIINEWDPYSLFPFAPNDEYIDEINRMNYFLKTKHDLDDLIKFLEEIFDLDIILDEEKKDFTKIAKKILNQAH